MKDNLINFKSYTAKDVSEFTWEDFKALWMGVSESLGEDEAWKILHATWQLRAGEIVE